MELKLCCGFDEYVCSVCINCTVVELKHEVTDVFAVTETSINCTVVELKHSSVPVAGSVRCINCTVVELKLLVLFFPLLMSLLY